MTDKPSTVEEEYFARENAEKLRKLVHEERARLKEAEAESLKKKHWMRCPKCGMELRRVSYKGVNVDRCFNCGGSFLDRGEVEKLVGSHGTLMEALINVFSTPKKG